MLAPKKIEPKKLVIYIAIMAIMLGGSGYLVYKNFTPQTPDTADIEVNIIGERVGDIDWDIEKETADEKEKEKEKDLVASDFDFLNNKKFKDLTDNFNEIPTEEAGTRNPFELSEE